MPCCAFIAPVGIRLPKAQEMDEQIDTVVQPDILVVCDDSKLDRRGVVGVADVLSPATVDHDHALKRRAYERAGVRELAGEAPIDIRPGVIIAWEELVRRQPKPGF